jgi:hypothetical protein
MSAIASDWILPETEAPTAVERRKYSREDEFRSALDTYIAQYVDHQKRRSGKGFSEQIDHRSRLLGGWPAVVRAIFACRRRIRGELGFSRSGTNL